MRRVLLYLAVGMVAYAGFLVVKLPASVAYGFVMNRVEPLAMAGVEGTAWSGRAQQVSYQSRAMGAVEWTVKPSAFLRGAVAADIRLQSVAGTVLATVTGGLDGSALIEEIRGELDVALLAPWLQLQSFRPQGELRLQLDAVEIRNGRPVRAAGELVWSEAHIQAPRAVAIGGLMATVSTTAQGIRALLRDRQSPFALDASVNLRPDGTYRLNGKVSARSEAPPEIHQMMQAFGVRQRGGALPLNLSGRL